MSDKITPTKPKQNIKTQRPRWHLKPGGAAAVHAGCKCITITYLMSNENQHAAHCPLRKEQLASERQNMIAAERQTSNG